MKSKFISGTRTQHELTDNGNNDNNMVEHVSDNNAAEQNGIIQFHDSMSLSSTYGNLAPGKTTEYRSTAHSLTQCDSTPRYSPRHNPMQSNCAQYGQERHITGISHKLGKQIRTILAAMTIAIGSFALTACANSAATTAASDANSDISFMLDWTPNTNHVGLYVAQQLGYFKDAGVNVKILPTAQAGAETSVENGVASVGFTTLSNVAAFNNQGADLKFVFDITQKPVARWCSLADRTDITTPKDFDGKTFVSFGSAEQNAVVAQMIKDAGGSGTFTTATAGTNTFQTLTSGKGDFGGFYATWEEIESKLNGPKLNCFVASDWGVPGNPDQLGFAVNSSWLSTQAHQKMLRKFLTAARRGYDYALAHPDKAADILIEQTKETQLDSKLTHASMRAIVDNDYWTTNDPKHLPAFTNTDQAQEYLDFQYQAGTYNDDNGKKPVQAPQASKLSTNKYLQ
jgi:ABC-type nitrate/sulfonate/bicarbonate transport system substrate-binding protein